MTDAPYVVLDHSHSILLPPIHGMDGYRRRYLLCSPAHLDDLEPEGRVYRREDMPAGWPGKWA